MCRYSFGTAVQVLPIPELMPFRLTRQMIGALQPHDARALLQEPCTLAMAALRSGKGILEVCNQISLHACSVSVFKRLKLSLEVHTQSMTACWLGLSIGTVHFHHCHWPESLARHLLCTRSIIPSAVQSSACIYQLRLLQYLCCLLILV